MKALILLKKTSKELRSTEGTDKLVTCYENETMIARVTEKPYPTVLRVASPTYRGFSDLEIRIAESIQLSEKEY